LQFTGFVLSVRYERTSFFIVSSRTVIYLHSFTPGSVSLHPGLFIYIPFGEGYESVLDSG
jgi:hypothetical protein